MALAVIMVLVVVGVLQRWTTNEYALTPGDATPVHPLVSIKGLPVDAHHDTIMLTDVYLQRLSAWQYIVMHFERHVTFLNADQILEPGIPSSQLVAQGFLEMADSKQNAEVAAFNSLGWHLHPRSTGAVVNGVVTNSPAAKAAIKVADEVVGVNGAPVLTTCQLQEKVHALAPGTRIALDVRRARISAAGDITRGRASTVWLRTAAPSQSLSSACANVTGPAKSWLGLSLEDGVQYQFPAQISINTKYIGGPSAGLAMTLSLIDSLSRGSLTGHHRIAATGTIDRFGNVGDVGGVAQKTVAVADAGAKYFFVPRVEVATATANAPAGLRIMGVTKLSQVLSDLARIGGAKPIPITPPR
ncbi:MAG: PDZ domain-containing protein [Acidimicrobiales bacterium]